MLVLSYMFQNHFDQIESELDILEAALSRCGALDKVKCIGVPSPCYIAENVEFAKSFGERKERYKFLELILMIFKNPPQNADVEHLEEKLGGLGLFNPVQCHPLVGHFLNKFISYLGSGPDVTHRVDAVYGSGLAGCWWSRVGIELGSTVA